MAATRLICPECNATLRPSQPVADGKRVKCPKCGAGFAAPGLIQEQVFEVVDDEKTVAPQSRPRPPAGKGKPAPRGGKPPAGRPKAKPTKPPDDDDDDEGGTYAFKDTLAQIDADKPEIDYAPDVSIKDLRGPAQGYIVRPSNFLLALAAINVLLSIAAILFNAWPFMFAEHVLDHVDYFYEKYDKSGDQRLKNRAKNLPPKREGLTEEEKRELEEQESLEIRNRIIFMVLFFLLAFYDGVVTAGAVKMQNMESRGWSLTAAIMTIVPVAGGGILYLLYILIPMMMLIAIDELDTRLYVAYGVMAVAALLISAAGGWALRVLLLQEVIDGFNYVAE
jgi:hypothetical protein